MKPLLAGFLQEAEVQSDGAGERTSNGEEQLHDWGEGGRLLHGQLAALLTGRL